MTFSARQNLIEERFIDFIVARSDRKGFRP